MAKKVVNTLNFEKALAELEQLVEKMEKGELSLEDSLKYFERGVVLTRDCQQALEKAEQRVQVLMQENGRTIEQAFERDE